MGLVKGDMGTGSSKQMEKELHLPGTNLKFNIYQLAALNAHFSDFIDNGLGYREHGHERTMVLMERLIQRLICGVGILDSRFASKFLVSLDPHKIKSKPGKSLSYLVRLDALSAPSLYEDSGGATCHLVECEGGPQGFAKIAVRGKGAEEWAEFINNQGYLRRDKVQERFVELLAQSAARSSLLTKPGEVDESRLCGSPGKVVDAETLHRILSMEASHQMFYGASDCYKSKFPDPRDFRIAIVEGCSCVRLRIGLIHLKDSGVETDIEVTLVLGIGFTSWPYSAHFPARISLCHIDCLLYHQAAATGFYVVPAPPHPTLRCDDRSSSWQIRFPAAEQTLLKHYSNNSVPIRVLRALRFAIQDIRDSSNGGHVISDYMLKTLLWFRMEEEESSVVLTMKRWTHDSLAAHVLTILDRLVTALKTQRSSSYFFPWFNVMLNAPGGGTMHYTDEDYIHDSHLVSCYLQRLGDLSSPNLIPGSESDVWRRMESFLVRKWSDIMADLTPPPATRSRRLSFNPISSSGHSTVAASQYSIRQLDYIGTLLRAMLDVKERTLSRNNDIPGWFHNSVLEQNPSTEDLVYLLSTILDQSRHLMMDSLKKEYYANSKTKARPKKEKIKAMVEAYDNCVLALLEEVRVEKAPIDYTDDNEVVRQVLKWLYHGLDKERKKIGLILRPYLSKLFLVSHENSWHMSEWRRRQEKDELTALGKFSTLVLEGRISVRDGILDAYQKGWNWAEGILNNCSELGEGVEIIFTPRAGKVIRHKITCKKLNEKLPTTTCSLGRKPMPCTSRGYSSATLPRNMKTFRENLKTRLQKMEIGDEEEDGTVHNVLKQRSPLTLAVEASHRYGNHRGIGSIIHALITLKKFTVLQELSFLLPESDRAQVLDEIQRVSREIRRPRRLSQTFSKATSTQIYRPTDELRRIPPPPEEDSPQVKTPSGTLMGTLRATRRKQLGQTAVISPDFFQEPLPSHGQKNVLTATSETFFTPQLSQEMVHLKMSVRKNFGRKNNAVTKL